MHWSIDPVLLNLGGIKVHWYGLIFALGLLGGYNITEWMLKKEQKDTKIIEPLFTYVVVGMIVGSRLAHCLFYDFSYYSKHPLEILFIWQGGLASHGGFFGVILALWLFSKKYNFSLYWLLSRGSIVAMLIASFIRVGNFFNSEIVGIKTNVAWGVIFDRVDSFARHPVVLYESICYFTIFVLLIFLYKKITLQKFTNIAFGLTLFLGFGSRVFIEQFKSVQSEFATQLPLSMGQLLSIPFIIAGAALLIYGLRNDNISN
jgi:prolipoprotein diacylglyceryl transferase